MKYLIILFTVLIKLLYILDDSSISDVINSCLNACNRHGIDYYRKKEPETQLDFNDIDTNYDSEELDNKDNSVIIIYFI